MVYWYTFRESWQREVTLWLHLSLSTCQHAQLFIWDLVWKCLPCLSQSSPSTALLSSPMFSVLLSLFINPCFLCSLSLLALPLSFSVGQSHRSDSIQLLYACDQLVNINSSSMADRLWAKTVCMWISHGKCWLIIGSVFIFVSATYWKTFETCICAQEKHIFVDTTARQTILINLPCTNCMFRIHRLLKHTAVPVRFLASSGQRKLPFTPLCPPPCPTLSAHAKYLQSPQSKCQLT